ncbi:potassium transporter Kup [Solimicrobium silvestre]|uniref:Probable potassium transport system protein Kup n=1 Tax=Solimicrobium silvestre TaxID=2099400 RepID=A0A2S9H4W2_9BURK|nr:KUP/HAK/KT family potassium transporter [Solimicrobium silvestre]PRC95019.1 K+ transporter [Solimicrobium silvestre]
MPALALAALGIVFGDLGTSPLYALQETFHPQRGVAASAENVMGAVSLFLWALIIMVSLKYVLVLMRADNRGEGGILALLTLLIGERSCHQHTGRRAKRWIFLALIGTAMLYGDGVITPAISVLSAIEGLQIATPAFQPYVVPTTIVILIGLFAIQPFGSGKVGIIFGPILLIWFLVIAALGLHTLWQNPAILGAINPMHGIRFFERNGGQGFIALGAVVLCLTGGEALYADMGHFGRRPIQLAWYGLALPSLALNYLGQGALLLSNPSVADRPFYSMVPTWGLYPMVALAALATIVASQALISAVFSLTRQAAQLGYSPRVEVIHTSGAMIGQVYLPTLNWLLMIGTIAIVLLFKTSDNLAAAFGLAVSTTMAITTILFAALARVRWHWSWWSVAAVAGVFFIADVAFVLANTLKFLDGGWLPLALGIAVFSIMASWYAERAILAKERRERAMPLGSFIDNLAMSPPHRVAGVAVFLTEEADVVPVELLHHLKHNQVLHERVVLLTLITEEVPRVQKEHSLSVDELPLGFISIIARFGFMEEPNVPNTLDLTSKLADYELFEPLSTTYFLGHQTLVLPRRRQWQWRGWLHRWSQSLFILLSRNEHNAILRFGLPPNRVVELGQHLEME